MSVVFPLQHIKALNSYNKLHRSICPPYLKRHSRLVCVSYAHHTQWTTCGSPAPQVNRESLLQWLLSFQYELHSLQIRRRRITHHCVLSIQSFGSLLSEATKATCKTCITIPHIKVMSQPTGDLLRVLALLFAVTALRKSFRKRSVPVTDALPRPAYTTHTYVSHLKM